ncbi:MAG: DNA helicase PcrA [Clostridia bacterium]|nr:DNA helicase PcrA [Clostridia bacterium]
MQNNILEGLNKEQYEAVTHVNGPLLVIAGAGSGKTRVLTHRVAHLISENNVNPWNVLAITFTNKAAKEMKERIEKILGEDVAKDMWVGTFHSVCVRILRREIERLGFDRNFLIFDTTDSKTIIKECIKELNLDDKLFGDKYLMGEISKAKNDMIDTIKYDNMYASDYRLGKVSKVYSLYQEKLRKNNAVDFDDIINHTIKIFKENEEVLEYYQNKFKYILVDEYQDTNKSQDMLINLLARESKNICVVGDDQQSIYKFRGADITNILNFEKNYADTKIIKLEQNYRSTKKILTLANAVIKNNKGNVDKKLWTENDDGSKPKFYQGNDEYEEANYVISQIKSLKREEYYPYSDFTILYRTNAQSRVFEEILMREGIPYKVVGGQKFYERKEIKDIIAYLRLVANTNDNVSLKRIINEPKRGIGKTTLEHVEETAERLNMSMFDVIKDVDKYVATRANASLKDFANFILKMQEDITSIEKLTTRILKESGYMQMLENEKTTEAEGRIENLGEFLNVVIDFEEQNAENTLIDFLENLALVTDLDNVDEEQENVLLMTLHTAKGLEFKNVFMVGMEDGLFPSYRSIGEEAEIEEERRLCYVGITRAKENLYLTCAKSRTIFGSTSYAMPSRFLTEVSSELMDGEVKKKKQVEENYYDNYGSYERYESNIDNAIYTFGKSVQTPQSAFAFRTAESFLQKINADETVDLGKFEIGQTIQHKKFGTGTITNIEPEDDDLKIEISFEKAGTKRLMAKFADLKIIE